MRRKNKGETGVSGHFTLYGCSTAAATGGLWWMLDDMVAFGSEVAIRSMTSVSVFIVHHCCLVLLSCLMCLRQSVC